jgi:hypothetical protein
MRRNDNAKEDSSDWDTDEESKEDNEGSQSLQDQSVDSNNHQPV